MTAFADAWAHDTKRSKDPDAKRGLGDEGVSVGLGASSINPSSSPIAAAFSSEDGGEATTSSEVIVSVGDGAGLSTGRCEDS